MLLGTHPIPARSPAEREGQNGKETRREGDRGGLEEAGKRRRGWGVCGWRTGIGRWKNSREKIAKKWGFGGDGESKMTIIHETGRREKMEGLLGMRTRVDG